tara:strand:+ start:100393 stop:102000 length:1608 start_codon:yes stop_codon:yes gene_type:complete
MANGKFELLAVRSSLSTALALALATPAFAQSDDEVLAKIMAAEINHSEVMDVAEYMDDVIGPRLTNSPGARKAEAWTQEKFSEWGLTNVHKEGFSFGRGWWIESSSVRMIAPRSVQLTAIPLAWTPPTEGTVTASVVLAPMTSEADFTKWRGKLEGKAVLVSVPVPAADQTTPSFTRRSHEEMTRRTEFTFPEKDPQARRIAYTNLDFWRKVDGFLADEKAAALIVMSRRDGKLLHGEGYRYEKGDTPLMPHMELAQEDYLRLARLAGRAEKPVIELNSNVHFDDTDMQAYNVIADIAGRDAKAGYVMAGAHLDSWFAGDGAADNGAGNAVVMEAARILKSIGVRPRRTIRFVLWAGEEQGLRGSLAYVQRHLAHRGGANGATPDVGIDHFFNWSKKWPIKPLPGYRDMKAYFNLDHGSGKIRGIYAERNPALVPIFKDWLEPFRSMRAANVFINDGGTGTDHYAMQSIGLPGFGFLQDQLDYSRVTHTNADTFDHLKADDMRQSAMILAWMLWKAANMKSDFPGESELPVKLTD